LPGRLEPLGRQRQCKWNGLGMIFPKRVQQRLHFGDSRVIELLDCGRQRLIEFHQRIACPERALHLDEIIVYHRRSRIHRELGAGLVGALRRVQRALEIFDDLGLEYGGFLAGFLLIIGGDQLIYLFDVVARHGRQQVAADPIPDRSQRAAQDPAGIGVHGCAVDQQRLQRREEIPRRGAGSILTGAVLAEFCTQFAQDFRRSRHFVVARFQPFELGQKIVSCHRRQPLQELPNPFGQCHDTQFPQSDQLTANRLILRRHHRA
jgi:hypothetical protein